MDKRAGIAIVIVLLVIVAGIYLLFVAKDNTQQQEMFDQTTPEETQQNTTTQEEMTSEEEQTTQTFVLTGSGLRFFMDDFVNPELRVKEGDKVRIEFSSEGGTHDWVLDAFDAATERVSKGESTFVEFIATEKGTYEYYCSVPGHRSGGMKGVFIVE